jgi:uncharacterized CHY-type Zn-finger protein
MVNNTVTFERKVHYEWLWGIIPSIPILAISLLLFVATRDGYLSGFPFLVIGIGGSIVLCLMPYSCYRLEKSFEDLEFKEFKPHNITVKDKLCCGNCRQIYTEEFPDIVFNVNQVEYFKMKMGGKYVIYSCIIDGKSSRTSLLEEIV